MSALFARSTDHTLRKAVFAPLSVLANDRVAINANGVVELQRLGSDLQYHTIDTRTPNYSEAIDVEPEPVSHDHTINHVLFFRGRSMSAQATITKISINQSDNSVTVEYGDGTSQDWADFATFKTFAADQVQLALAKTLLLISAAGRSESGTDLADSVGSSVTIDPAAGVQFAFSGIPSI